jgi:DNA-binding IclR family transcriptional regulator
MERARSFLSTFPVRHERQAIRGHSPGHFKVRHKMASSPKYNRALAATLLPQTEPDVNGDSSHRAPISTTVAKAMGIVDILASKAEVGVSLSELSLLIGMPKSTTHRYIATLQSVGLAERKGLDHYRLGTKVIELAGSFLAKSDLRIESQASLNELAEMTGETIHLAVASGTGVVYIAKIESKYALGMFSHIGARLPMHSTALGKAILAFSAPERLEAVLAEHPEARTPSTITSAKALKVEMVSIRSQGFALDNEENEIGICCVSAPIIDYTGTAIAAISISGPRERMDRERCIQLGPLLWETTQRVSRRQGFTGNLHGVTGEAPTRMEKNSNQNKPKWK